MSQFEEDLTQGKSAVVAPPGTIAGAGQFATAEYSDAPGTERCRICGKLVSGQSYRVNNQMACASCASQSLAGQPLDSHAAFVRGAMLGSAAAIVGLIAYAAFTIITGWQIGYLALGVGWLVAKGITKGANGLGGRRYQVLAVALTYAAISMAAIPIGVSYLLKHPQRLPAAVQRSDNAFPEDAAAAEAAPRARAAINWPLEIGKLALLGLISPFMALRDPLHGAIGIFILYLGLQIAWRLTEARRLAVEGPYPVQAA